MSRLIYNIISGSNECSEEQLSRTEEESLPQDDVLEGSI